MTHAEACQGQRLNIDRVRLPIQDLLGNQQSDTWSVLKAMPAETVRKDESRQLRMRAQNRMRIRRRLVAAGPRILNGSFGDRWKAIDCNLHHLIEEVLVHTQVECGSFLTIVHYEKAAT